MSAAPILLTGRKYRALDPTRNVCFWHKADIPTGSINVRFGGRADIAAKLLTKDEARRIAANIAKLAELLDRKDYCLSAAGAGVASVGRDIVFNAHPVL